MNAVTQIDPSTAIELPSPLPVAAAPLPIGQLTKAIADVMEEVNVVAKRGENSFHRYRYAKMEDILKEITPLLGRHGLVIFQSEVSRAMFDDGGVIAVEYAFSVAHKSGEQWSRELRQTGVSRCRDSKGGWDDKSLNKCHTAARKYFLLSLFQIPTGEEDDSDKGDNDRRESAPRKTTLSKKDGRGVYEKMQAEIDKAPSLDALRTWGEEAAERIAILPIDWQDVLRLRYSERLVELRQFPPKAEPAKTAEPAHDADGVIWEENGERPATAADLDGIPPFLDRRAAPEQVIPTNGGNGDWYAAMAARLALHARVPA